MATIVSADCCKVHETIARRPRETPDDNGMRTPFKVGVAFRVLTALRTAQRLVHCVEWSWFVGRNATEAEEAEHKADAAAIAATGTKWTTSRQL